MRSALVEIRPAHPADVPRVVDVHLASFPGFFLTSLGPRFLRLFYRGLIDQEHGRLLVASVEREIVGFVGGAVEQVGFYSRLKRDRFWPFVLEAGWVAIRRPRVLRRLVRARRRASGGEETPPGACLMTLGVLPGLEGHGAGRRLVKAFVDELESSGCSRVLLTTDAEDNDRVNSFYGSLGFTLTRVIVTPEGRNLNEYVLEIEPGLQTGATA